MKKRNEQKSQTEGQTELRRPMRRPVVPPPDSEIWPEQCRGKRWRLIFAYLFAGKCQLCTYSCPLPRGIRQSARCAGLPTVLLCTNHPRYPGELVDVLPRGTCRNFRAARWKPAPSGQAPDGAPGPTATSDSDPEVRRIPLGHGLVATVDAADYEEIKKYTWHACRNGAKVYALCHKDGKQVSMHRLIMKAPKGTIVDHIDLNTLSNRRCNLRVCTEEQNLANRGPKGGSSRYVGVSRCGKKWRAGIIRRGEYFYLGLFDEEVEAAKARDRKAVELLGQYAYLNFPEDWTFDENGVGRPRHP